MSVICCQDRKGPALSNPVRKEGRAHRLGHRLADRDKEDENTMNSWLPRSLGISAAAIMLAALAYGGVSAQEKKTAQAKPAACNSLKDETACMGRDDCSWIAASVDPKTNKTKRKAYCRSKPKSKTKT
jgi:hypothetical protein